MSTCTGLHHGGSVPRKYFIHTPNIPNYVWTRHHRRIPSHLLFPIWSVFEDHLYFCQKAFNLRVHAFLLTDYDVHMIARAPSGNLSQSLQYFFRQASLSIGTLSKTINQQFGCQSRKCELRQVNDLEIAYKYLFQIPVQRGQARHVLDFPFSTLPRVLGFFPLYVPIETDELLFSDTSNRIAWLNRIPAEEHWGKAETALNKRTFAWPRNRNGFRFDLESHSF